MTGTGQSLNEESHRQLQQAWSYFATHLPDGTVSAGPGLLIADGRSPLPFMNVAILSEPVADEAALRERIDHAAAYFRRQGLHWMLMAPEDLCGPALAARLTTIAGEAGLQYMMPMAGMAAETLQPPVRRLPALDLRPVADEATRRAVSDLNAAGYDMPGDLMHAASGVPALWSEMVGVVGYVDGVPASTASVTPVDGVAYVALVATHPDHQRKGLAEAVMRQALDEARTRWGCQRTVLHATPAGRPVYTRMGYEDVVTFHVYVGE